MDGNAETKLNRNFCLMLSFVDNLDLNFALSENVELSLLLSLSSSLIRYKA